MTPGREAIGLVIALPEELRPLAAALRLRREAPGLYRGAVGRRRVVALAAGLGIDCAARGARRLVGQERVAGLLSLGFGGALAEGLPVGGTVAVREAVAQDESRLPADSAWVDQMTALTDREGACLTMIVPVRTPEEKRALGALTGALVVDMETGAVARVAAEHHVPWVGLRAVSDAVDDVIPAVVHQRIRPQQGRIDTPGMILHVLPRPGHWPDLLALARRSKLAAKRLSETAAAFLEKL